MASMNSTYSYVGFLEDGFEIITTEFMMTPNSVMVLARILRRGLPVENTYDPQILS